MPLSPLSERVAAPVALEPDPVPGVVWRPATLDDVEQVVALMGAMARVDHPDWAETLEDVEPEFTPSWVDVARDGLAGEIDGRLVAFGLVIAPPDPETIVRSILEGGVHPEFRGRGIGRALLAWQVGRARQQLAASDRELPGWVYVISEDGNEGANRLFARGGFSPERYYWQLQRVLADPIPELELPAPLRLVHLDTAHGEATRLARNEAFRDHWGSQPTGVEQWETFLTIPSRRRDLSFLALEGDEVVGFVIAETTESDWELQGFTSSYIALVGVVPRWRRRGVAPALLARSLRATRDAGLERAVLDVDSESPTGALGLYTGMGFTAVSGSRVNILAF